MRNGKSHAFLSSARARARAVTVIVISTFSDELTNCFSFRFKETRH
jgi:hypothetical protein